MVDNILQKSLNICIATIAVLLETVKTNSTGTTFEWNLFFSDFSFVILLKIIRTFPFEALKSILHLSAKIEKNNGRFGNLCLIGEHILCLIGEHYNARIFSFFKTSGPKLKTGSEKLLYLLWCMIKSQGISHGLQVSHE